MKLERRLSFEKREREREAITFIFWKKEKNGKLMQLYSFKILRRDETII